MSTEPELTPWFSALNEQPVRIGEYEMRGPFVRKDRRFVWTGKGWIEWLETRGGPRPLRFLPGTGDEWRGLMAPATEEEMNDGT